MSASSVPPPFAASAAAEPPACRAAALHASLATTQRAGGNGFLAGLRLRAAGPPCTLNEVWPTVRLDEAAGHQPAPQGVPPAPPPAAGDDRITPPLPGRTPAAAPP